MTSNLLKNCVCILFLIVSIAKSLPVEDIETEEILEGSDNEALNVTNTRIVNNPSKEENETNTKDKIKKTSVDIAENVGSNTIAGASNIFGNFLSIATKVVDLQARAIVQGVDTASKTADAISKSEAANKIADVSLKTAGVAVEGSRRLGETIIEGSRVVGEGVSKAAAVAAPVVLNSGLGLITGIEDLSRIKICLFICPLQGKEDQEQCRKDNCGKKDRSDGLDYYDGDFKGFDY